MPDKIEGKERANVKRDWGMQTQSVPKLRPLTYQRRVARSPLTRPMLARVAESMYWMSRYIERSEHVARVVWVNFNVLMDMGDLAQTMQEKQWQSVMRILRLHDSPDGIEILKNAGSNIGMRITEFMTFDTRSRNSSINCLTKARENARSIRESISVEMWETLNTLYWSIQSDESKQGLAESPQQILNSVIMGSLLFQGVTDQTLPHGQGWQFIQLAKYLERIEMTCRVIEAKFDILRSQEWPLEGGGSMSNIQWMAVLRSCSSIEAFRRRHVGDLDPQRVVAFLIFDKESPRSIRYCLTEAQKAVSGIAMAAHPLEVDPLERILARLEGQLELAEARELSNSAVKSVLDQILEHTAEAASAIQRSYFLN